MEDMAALCTSCGECVAPCAFLQREGTPGAVAERGSGNHNLLKAFQCSLCGLCDALCPEKLSPAAMFLDMRRQAVASGLFDRRAYKPWLNYEKLGGSAFFRRDHIPRGCATVFFPGCALAGRSPQTVLDLYKQLQHIEPSAGLVLDCCGKISHGLGLEDNFSAIISRLEKRLAKRGIKRILTTCPGCSKILRKSEDRFDILSLYEELAANGQTASVAEDAPVVTVHDPCPARFDEMQQQAVRTLVSQAGFRIEEMQQSGRKTRCCGQGGMVEGCVPGTLEQEGKKVMEMAGKHSVVTSCAACADSLERHLPTVHVAELEFSRINTSARSTSSAGRWLNRLKLKFARLK